METNAGTISGILSMIHFIIGEQLYLEVNKWVPNWSVSNLFSFVASELVTAPESPFVLKVTQALCSSVPAHRQ